MSALIDDFQESISDRDELFNSLARIKLDFIDLEACKNTVEQENCSLKKQVEQLDSSNNDLKSEVLKLTLSGKKTPRVKNKKKLNLNWSSTKKSAIMQQKW